MESEKVKELTSYKIQLEHVENILKIEPDNKEMIELKDNLVSVIELTEQLIATEGEDLTATNVKGKKNKPESRTNQTTAIDILNQSAQEWKPGDKCLAPISQDGCLRQGTIIVLNKENDTCSVYFEAIDHSETIEISRIKYIPRTTTKSTETQTTQSKKTNNEKLKIKQMKLQKQQKRAHKLQIIEESHEKIKSNWKSFINNNNSKNKLKGINRKSILKSYNAQNGKIGVFTNSNDYDRSDTKAAHSFKNAH